MSPGEAAKFLGVSVQTLLRWRSIGEGPKYFSLNGGDSERRRGVRVRYRKLDLVHYMETGQTEAPRECACGARTTVDAVQL